MAYESIILNIEEDLSRNKDPGKTYLKIELQDIQDGKLRHTYIVMGYDNYYHWEDICHEWLRRNPDPLAIWETCAITGLKLAKVKGRRNIINGDSKPRIIEWHTTGNRPTPAEQLFEYKEADHGGNHRHE